MAKPLFEFGYPRYVVFGLDIEIECKNIVGLARICPTYKLVIACLTTYLESVATGWFSLRN